MSPTPEELHQHMHQMEGHPVSKRSSGDTHSNVKYLGDVTRSKVVVGEAPYVIAGEACRHPRLL
jgi:hypothetical protein